MPFLDLRKLKSRRYNALDDDTCITRIDLLTIETIFLFQNINANRLVPLIEHILGEVIDGVAPLHLAFTCGLTSLQGLVNGAVFRTISLFVIWTV